jgi:hypothetical protein
VKLSSSQAQCSGDSTAQVFVDSFQRVQFLFLKLAPLRKLLRSAISRWIAATGSLDARFQELSGELIVFPATPGGEQRNPVIWPRRFFGLLKDLSWPQGGKRLLKKLADSCSAVVVSDEKALFDVDAPECVAPG